MSSKQPIDVPLEIRTIAQMCEPPVETWKMRRRLLRWHRETDETILVKVNGRWQVTIASLRRVWPSFGRKFAEQEDLDDMGARVTKAERRIRSTEIGLTNLRARMRSLENQLRVAAGIAKTPATEDDRAERQTA